MAYNENLANKVREVLSDHPTSALKKMQIDERKMFGGLAFMINKKMCVGILQDKLMARIDPEIYVIALQKKGCKEMDFTGRPMKGFVFVEPAGTGTKKALAYWIELALEFNKKAKASKPQRRRS